MADTTVALVGDQVGFEPENGLKGVLDEHVAPTVDLGPETSDPVDDPNMTAEPSEA
jgi:hypothetical protein